MSWFNPAAWWCWFVHGRHLFQTSGHTCGWYGFRCKKCGRRHWTYVTWKDPDPDPGTPPTDEEKVRLRKMDLKELE